MILELRWLFQHYFQVFTKAFASIIVTPPALFFSFGSWRYEQQYQSITGGQTQPANGYRIMDLIEDSAAHACVCVCLCFRVHDIGIAITGDLDWPDTGISWDTKCTSILVFLFWNIWSMWISVGAVCMCYVQEEWTACTTYWTCSSKGPVQQCLNEEVHDLHQSPTYK